MLKRKYQNPSLCMIGYCFCLTGRLILRACIFRAVLFFPRLIFFAGSADVQPYRAVKRDKGTYVSMFLHLYIDVSAFVRKFSSS